MFNSYVSLPEGKFWGSLLDKKTARLCFSRLLDFVLWYVFFQNRRRNSHDAKSKLYPSNATQGLNHISTLTI